jgi:Uncharacterised protein family (UPF0259)
MENQTQEQEVVQTHTESPVATPPLLGPIALLKEAWGIYKSNFWQLVGITAIPSALILAVILLMGGGALMFVLFFLRMKLLGIVLLSIFALLAFVVIMVVSAWSQVALIVAARDSQERIGIQEAYRRGRQLILSYWKSIFLVGFVVLGGIIFFIVPGVIFAVWLSLVTFVVVCEDAKGMDALVRSREYVQGKSWAVFWRIAFAALISMAASLLVSALFSVLKIPSLILNQVAKFIVSICVTPLTTIYMYLMYKNVKDIHSSITSNLEKPKTTMFIVFAWIGGILIPIIICGAIAAAVWFSARAHSQNTLEERLNIQQVTPVK